MKRPPLFWKLLALLALFAALPLARAQTGAVAREIATQLGEKLGQRGARELAEAGGEAIVRETIEKAAHEGGEQLAREVAGMAERYGAQTLGAFREAPQAMVQAMKKVPAELADQAMRAVAREPATVAKLVAAHGEDVLVVAAKHPGVGVDLAQKLGSEGCQVAKELTTDNAIRLARMSEDLAKLPPAERAGILARVAKSPVKVLEWLEKHPKVLTTAVLAAGAYETIDRMLGTSTSPGFLERVATQFHDPLSWVIIAAAVLLFVRVVWWWRRRHVPQKA